MSTENVRRAFLRGATTPDAPIATSLAVERAFDRWFAEERRAAAEKAWDEGVAAMDPDAVAMVSALNPYRVKETEA